MRDLTDITIILDRSGSMSDMHSGVVEGYNEFITRQQQVPGDAVLSLVEFHAPAPYYYSGHHGPNPSGCLPRSFQGGEKIHDDWYVKRYNAVPFGQLRPWGMNDFTPGGNTAMFAAVSRTIDELGARLRDTPEHLRPNKVVVFLISDGLENSSQFCGPYAATGGDVGRKISHQRDQYNWEFVFLGTNQDSFKSSAEIGGTKSSTRNYAPSSAGMVGAVRELSKGLVAMRCSTEKEYSSNKGNFFENTLALREGTQLCGDIPEAKDEKPSDLSKAADPVATLKGILDKKTKRGKIKDK